MDRGGLEDVDVHDGLETTLVVLGYKLKRADVRVERDYDRSLPRLIARGSELNQVWTNLLDNAIDALDGQDRSRSCTRPRRPIVRSWRSPTMARRPGGLAVDGSSTRSSAPRTWATGTGLGLDTARRIVIVATAARSRRPDETRFRVRLPLDGLRQPAIEGGRMTACTHLDQIPSQLPEPSPAARTAWRSAAAGCTCGSAWSAGMSAAATTRPTGTPRARPRDGHPIIRSLEPGEDWSWCFVDEVAMVIPEVDGRDPDPALAARRMTLHDEPLQKDHP